MIAMLRALLVALFLITGAAQPASAGAFEDGLAAYDAGDYPTALRLWMPLARQGNATAQFNLGLMYGNGRGVPQNYVLAHMWSNLASASGNANAPKNRDAVAAKMTPAQIAEAQRLAAEWKPK